MSRVVMAQVIIKDSCDPDEPGSCSPIIQLEAASELENLVSEYGVIFEEPIKGQEERFTDPVDDAEPWKDLGGDQAFDDHGGDDAPWEDPVEAIEAPEPEGDMCPLEPDRPWDESVCGELERRILSRMLGG